MKKSDVYLGRFQPPHQAHVKIIGMMNNPVIVIVKGVKSSKDKTKNPLGIKDQIRMLKKMDSSLKIVEVKTGYIPDIIEQLKELNIEVDTVYAGPDRQASYKAQITGYNKKEENVDKLETKIKPIKSRFTDIDGDEISATRVRNAIKSDDFETFKKLMPKKLVGEWNKLRKLIK